MFEKLAEALGLNGKSRMKGTLKKILVVEDNEVDRKVIKEILEKQNHHVVIAENGQVGLEVAKAEKPDLVILDCEMPVMDGLTACKKLKEDNDLAGIPVIFLTSVNTPNNVIDCFQSDAENFLSKPVNAKILLAEVNAIFNRAVSS